jgi:hypothetical protein
VARIAIVHQPVAAIDRAYQHEHMMVAHCSHSGRWRGLWKFSPPVGSQIELGANFTKQIA